jgi:hypothetical protein
MIFQCIGYLIQKGNKMEKTPKYYNIVGTVCKSNGKIVENL